MAKGRKTGGRQRGTSNKLTRDAKQAFQFAFNEIGGEAHLAAWAMENTTEFYKLFARLIPVDNRHSDADGRALNFTLYVPSKQ